MNRRLIVLFAALALSGLPGCWFTGSWWSDSDDDVYVDYDDGWTDSYGRSVEFQQMQGELGGHIVEMSGATGTANSGWGTSLEVDTIQENGSWALFRLDTGVDLYDPSLTNGTVLSATADDVDLMGCTGDAPYEFDYDGYASEVEVEVSQGAEPDLRQIDFRGTFQDGFSERVVTGTVILDLSDTGPTYGSGSGYGTPTTQSVQWNGVQSDLGDQGAYAIDSVGGNGYFDGYYSSVEFETTEPGQWVLFRVSSYGTDLLSAQPGDVIEDGELMGCTGDSPGSFDYDGYASQVRIEVLEGLTANDRIAHVTGTFDTEWGTQTVDATYSYQVY